MAATESTFTMEELNRYTNNFDEKRIVGKGSFSTVYSGVTDNRENIAVKKYTAGSQHTIQFTNEMHVFKAIKTHANIVKCLGYCEDGISQKYIVLELMHHNLEGDIEELNWKTTLKVLTQIAKGLAAIQDKGFIIGDLKPPNILLDENKNAKICDFGSATQGKFVICATDGYKAPEGYKGKWSKASDIYSYGVIILQLIQRQRIVSTKDPNVEGKEIFHGRYKNTTTIVDRARESIIIHADLRNDMKTGDEESIGDLSLKCVKENPLERPPIREVIQILEKLAKPRKVK